jgi:hypothetical protein
MQGKLQGGPRVVMTRKSILVIVVAVVVAAAVLAVIATYQSRERDRQAAESAATSSTDVTSPYDVTEVTGELDLDILEDATFLSILAPNAEGEFISYMADADGDAAKALIDAVRKAPEVKLDNSEGSTTTAASAVTSTLTFMLPSRQIVTFTLDLDAGILTRQGQAWRPRADLEALVETATTAPSN